MKTDRRVFLGEDRLDHILRIRIEGPPLEGWDAARAVELWWASNELILVLMQLPEDRKIQS